MGRVGGPRISQDSCVRLLLRVQGEDMIVAWEHGEARQRER